MYDDLIGKVFFEKVSNVLLGHGGCDSASEFVASEIFGAQRYGSVEDTFRGDAPGVITVVAGIGARLWHILGWRADGDVFDGDQFVGVFGAAGR